MKKVIGKVFKEFYRDEKFWGPETYHEDTILLINDDTFNEDTWQIEDIKDTDIVTIDGGFIVNHPDLEDGCSFEKFYAKWLKQQTTTRILIEISNDKLEGSLNHLKKFGFKIIAPK